MTDVLLPELRSHCISGNRSKDTKQELVIRKGLVCSGPWRLSATRHNKTIPEGGHAQKEHYACRNSPKIRLILRLRFSNSCSHTRMTFTPSVRRQRATFRSRWRFLAIFTDQNDAF